jgi:hypothetical protein
MILHLCSAMRDPQRSHVYVYSVIPNRVTDRRYSRVSSAMR